MPTKMDAPPKIVELTLRICEQHEVALADLLSPRKNRKITACRWQTWYEIRKLTGPLGRPYSTTRIGNWFNRDHSSVSHGLHQYKNLVNAGHAPG
jgi:chromosomal replication initiation ATPase DnaA